jgi:hypothetical protein
MAIYLFGYRGVHQPYPRYGDLSIALKGFAGMRSILKTTLAFPSMQ